MKGLALVKLNVQATEMTLEALRACDRIFKKTHDLVARYPEGSLPLIVYDMHGTIPMTVHALKLWIESTVMTEEELLYRINTCVDILRNELRANHVFERFRAQPAP